MFNQIVCQFFSSMMINNKYTVILFLMCGEQCIQWTENVKMEKLQVQTTN